MNPLRSFRCTTQALPMWCESLIRSIKARALTPAGEKALARFARLVRAHEKRIAAGLSSAETRTLIGLLEKVHSGARSL